MREIEIEWGPEPVAVRVPDRTVLLAPPDADPLKDPMSDLMRGLETPIGCEPLEGLVRRKRARTAVVVVSDSTRPVPYAGRNGILAPLLFTLRRAGIADITILVATGTHRGLRESEMDTLLGPAARAAGVRVMNHDGMDRSGLRFVGRTSRGTEAWVNRRYLEADLKVLTGLVEPHFMAGFSGGRKGICPGLVGRESMEVFHGPEIMSHPRADSLILDGNPCHEEARDVARLAGCDFSVQVTLTIGHRITGIYCGAMEATHAAACDHARKARGIPIPRPYDLVLTHAGVGGVNHYQAAKAAWEAAKAVRPGGVMILAARHTEADPVGGAGYRRRLPLLTELGPEGFNDRIRAADWTFTPDQWEVQKWAGVLARLGATGRLVYCAPRLTGEEFARAEIPAVDGGLGLADGDERRLVKAMIERAVERFLASRPDADVAILPAGPYGVPVLAGMSRTDRA